MTSTVPLLELGPLFDGNRASDEALADVMAHPAFTDVMRVVTAGSTELLRGNRIVNAIMTDRGRFLLSVFAVYLHAQAKPRDPATGLTPSRMKALFAPHKICSPGRIDAMLTMMRLFSFLEPMPEADDRRLRRLQPTERLMEWHRRRCRFTFLAISRLMPEGAAAIAAMERPGFLQAFQSRLAEIYLSGYFYVEVVPETRMFFERNGGLVSVFSLLMAGETGDTFPPERPVSISFSALSRTYGVSRAHLRRLLAHAETEGLVLRMADKGDAWRILPKLAEATRKVIAHYIVHNAHAVRLALGEFHQEGLAA